MIRILVILLLIGSVSAEGYNVFSGHVAMNGSTVHAVIVDGYNNWMFEAPIINHSYGNLVVRGEPYDQNRRILFDIDNIECLEIINYNHSEDPLFFELNLSIPEPQTNPEVHEAPLRITLNQGWNLAIENVMHILKINGEKPS